MNLPKHYDTDKQVYRVTRAALGHSLATTHAYWTQVVLTDRQLVTIRPTLRGQLLYDAL